MIILSYIVSITFSKSFNAEKRNSSNVITTRGFINETVDRYSNGGCGWHRPEITVKTIASEEAFKYARMIGLEINACWKLRVNFLILI